jgi:hypothetical protein
MRENPDGDTDIAAASGQAVAGQEAATGRIASETSGRMARPTAERNRRTANLAEHRPRIRRQPLPANTDITDTHNPTYQEANRTRTGAGTTLADVLRAIASLSETDRELLLQLLKTLQGANT